MTDLARLQRAIRDLHGLESEHVRSEPVHETFQGKTVWKGVVEVFRVYDHPQAKFACVWDHETDEGGRNYIAVLGVGPIKAPVDAVRVAIVAQSQKA